MGRTRLTFKDRNEWLNARNQGIGASEVATIIGLNPYETPYQLWRRKVGLDEPKQENFAMKAGHILEDAVAKFFSDETGLKVIDNTADDFMFIDKNKPFLRVSPDRLFWLPNMTKNDNNKGILECKTTQKTIDPDNIPKTWFCQVQMNLGVANYEHGALAWLTSGREFGYVNIDFDANFYSFLVEEVEKFWLDYVLPKKEPEMVSAEDVVLKYEIPQSDKSIIADSDITAKIAQLKELKSSIDELEAKAKEYEDSIKIYFADAEKITNNIGDVLATWKGSTLSKFDSKKFKEENPDLYEKYVKPVSTRRFILK